MSCSDSETGTRFESATVAPLCASVPSQLGNPRDVIRQPNAKESVRMLVSTVRAGFLICDETQNKALRTGRGLAVRRKSENLPAVRKHISGFHSSCSQATSRCDFRLSGETAGWRPRCSRVQEHSAIFRPDRAFGIVKRLSADGRRYGRFEPPFLLRERRLFLLLSVRPRRKGRTA